MFDEMQDLKKKKLHRNKPQLQPYEPRTWKQSRHFSSLTLILFPWFSPHKVTKFQLYSNNLNKKIPTLCLLSISLYALFPRPHPGR
jgi:hypothetical protein